MNRAVLLLFLLCAACGDTGQHAITFPVHASGSESPSFMSGAWTVTIEEARVGFGPVYFCASQIGACDTARAEWLGTAAVDGIDPSVQMLGDANGVTGSVHSAMFDYGRTWVLPAPEAMANEGAPEGHSLVLRGTAVAAARSFSFEALVDIDAANAGEQAIGVLRTERTLDGTEALIVHVDPVAWAQQIDFEELSTLEDAGAAHIVEGTTPYDSLVVAMRASLVPTFEWVQP